LKNHPNGPPVRYAEKVLDLPARSRFGEGRAENLLMMDHSDGFKGIAATI